MEILQEAGPVQPVLRIVRRIPQGVWGVLRQLAAVPPRTAFIADGKLRHDRSV